MAAPLRRQRKRVTKQLNSTFSVTNGVRYKAGDTSDEGFQVMAKLEWKLLVTHAVLNR